MKNIFIMITTLIVASTVSAETLMEGSYTYSLEAACSLRWEKDTSSLVLPVYAMGFGVKVGEDEEDQRKLDEVLRPSEEGIIEFDGESSNLLVIIKANKDGLKKVHTYIYTQKGNQEKIVCSGLHELNNPVSWGN